MTSDTMPIYYHPGSILDVELEPQATTRQFAVVRALTPFTVAQILIVRESTGNHYGGEEILMKIYDSRFMKDRSTPWSPELEAQGVESRKDWRMPAVLTPYDIFRCSMRKALRNRSPPIALQDKCGYFS